MQVTLPKVQEGDLPMTNARKFFTERNTILLIYGIAFWLGVIILAVGLWQSHWDIYVWLNNPLVKLLLLFSTTVIRILAGFGLIATYIAVIEALLAIFSRILKARRIASMLKGVRISDLAKTDKIADAVKSFRITESFKREKISEAVKGKKISEIMTGKKGKKARIAGVVFFMVLVPFAILTYVSYRFVLTVLYGAPQTLFDVAYLMIGIWGLLLTIYLIPVIKGEPIALTGKLSELRDRFKEGEVRKGLSNLANKITGLYSSKVKKEEVKPAADAAIETYAEAFAFDHAQDYAEELDKIGFEKVRETVLAYRHSITDDLLLPVALGSLIVPPVALLFLVIFVKAFILRREVGRSILEKLIIVAAVLMTGLYASVEIIFAFFAPSAELLISFDYLIGSVIGVIVFIYLARKAL
jgi:hypothetical protein